MHHLLSSSDYVIVFSKFEDIFDEEFFIDALKHHVKVVRELPEDVLQRFDNNLSNIVNLRVKGWSSPTHYLHKVLPKLVELGYVSSTFLSQVSPFSFCLFMGI